MYPATTVRGMCGAQRKAERRSENGEEKGERAVVDTRGEGEGRSSWPERTELARCWLARM